MTQHDVCCTRRSFAFARSSCAPRGHVGRLNALSESLVSRRACGHVRTCWAKQAKRWQTVNAALLRAFAILMSDLTTLRADLASLCAALPAASPAALPAALAASSRPVVSGGSERIAAELLRLDAGESRLSLCGAERAAEEGGARKNVTSRRRSCERQTLLR